MSAVMVEPLLGPVASMLMPQAYDASWTALNDGVFNDYPPPPSAAQLAAQLTNGSAGQVPVPNGTVPWTNPTDAASTPITTATPSGVAVLQGNAKRNLLIIQNNSIATTAGDTTPDFWIEFGRAALVNFSIRIKPGEGLVLDTICPRSQLYVTIGPFSNVGLSTIVAGVITQGCHSPDVDLQQRASGIAGSLGVMSHYSGFTRNADQTGS